jgi:hypothetical protein
MTRQQFAEIAERIGEIEEAYPALKPSGIIARHMAIKSTDENFKRFSECAWKSIYAVLEYAELKAKDKNDQKGLIDIRWILTMMDAQDAGSVLFFG